MKYFFDVVPPKGMEGKILIAKPSKAFMATPGMRKKKVVTLSTTEHLATDERHDTIIPITIHAYALDSNGKKSEKISVNRKQIFIYPKESVLKKAK